MWYVAVYVFLLRWTFESTIILAAAAAAVLFMRQPAKKLRLIEWSFVACLVLPCLTIVDISPRWSFFPAHAIPLANEAVPQDRPFERPAPASRISEGAAKIEPAALASSAARATPEAPRPPRRPRWPWRLDPRLVVATGYLAGVGLMFVLWLAGLIGLARVIWAAEAADERCLGALRRVAGGPVARGKLLVSRLAVQPFVYGVWRPVIVLPERLVSADEHSLRWGLAHEWSHAARGDARWWSLAGVVRLVLFHQPLVWWLRGQMRLAQDYLADAEAAGRAPEDYAQFLVTWAGSGGPRPLYGGVRMLGRKSDLYRRVVMLAENRQSLDRSCSRRWSLGVALLLLLAVGAVATYKGVANDKPQEAGRLPVGVKITKASIAAVDDKPQPADRGKEGAEARPTETKQHPTDERAATTEKVIEAGSIKEPVGEKSARQPTAARRKEDLRYSGRTFQDWREKLLNDLDPKAIMEAMEPIKAFGKMGYGAEAAEALSEVMHTDRALDDGGFVAMQAAAALARIGAEGAPTLIEGLGDPRPEVRAACVNAVAVLGAAGRPATDALVKLLADDTEYVRRSAVKSLVVLAGDNADIRPAFERLARNDETEMRQAFVTAMRSDPPQGDWWVGLLVRLADDESPEIRAAVGSTLATHGPTEKRVVETLERLVGDSDLSVFDETLSSVVHGSKPETLALFLANALKQSDVWNRLSMQGHLRHVIDRLSRAPDQAETTIPLLIAIVELKAPSWSPSDVMAAMDGLGRFGPAAKAAIPAVTRWASREYPSVDAEKKHADRALQKIRGEDAEGNPPSP